MTDEAVEIEFPNPTDNNGCPKVRYLPTSTTRVVMWIVQVVVALDFGSSSAFKLLSEQTTVEGFRATGFPDWSRYAIGACELAGAVAMFVPILTGLAAVCLVALMIGATAATALGEQASAWPVPAVTLVVVAALAWWRRDSLSRLYRRVIHRQIDGLHSFSRPSRRGDAAED
ncbi:MAG TPA: DoxX family protein [Stackebrandtia sp.]|jgi:uncharacterized membrane protein YphA (DoxX/SURF4 family)|uniref:DoxX family protein n=1 Tax=Stackebrandtia sp. TaxID=2023065 RepID=UPI002D67BC5A|nr:DoxX family protein [Stackebrandtia sp.]HZE38924.1 DoxX family protein [Stackebrandtia sp.]